VLEEIPAGIKGRKRRNAILKDFFQNKNFQKREPKSQDPK
jgi:hypothetical protein